MTKPYSTPFSNRIWQQNLPWAPLNILDRQQQRKHQQRNKDPLSIVSLTLEFVCFVQCIQYYFCTQIYLFDLTTSGFLLQSSCDNTAKWA